MVTSLGKWAFLNYRLPREPSAPRLALWRALRRLGALLIGDGLATLPLSTRNLEHLEWLAAGIRESRGSASVWLAQPSSARVHWEYVEQMQRAADEEYQVVLREARRMRVSDEVELRWAVRRMRAQLRRIQSRDYFAAADGKAARAEVEGLAQSIAEEASV